jgi:hypothetical protein
MVGDVGGEGVECAAGHAGRSIGVAARAPAIDDADHPVHLGEKPLVDSAVRENIEQSCQPG